MDYGGVYRVMVAFLWAWVILHWQRGEEQKQGRQARGEGGIVQEEREKERIDSRGIVYKGGERNRTEQITIEQKTTQDNTILRDYIKLN